jgi:hypothetical protein
MTLLLKTPLLRHGPCAWCQRVLPLTYGCCSQYCRMRAGPVALRASPVEELRLIKRRRIRRKPIFLGLCPCVACGSAFTPIGSIQKTCQACIEARCGPRNCAECGATIDPKSGRVTPKYCGFICQRTAWRRQRKEACQCEQRKAADRVREAMLGGAS